MIELGIRSIWYWISLLGDKPIGIFSRNKWLKQWIREMVKGWLCKGASSSSWTFKFHSLKALNSSYEAFKRGSLKVSNKSQCSSRFYRLLLCSSDEDKGTKVIFFSPLEKEYVFENPLCINLLSYNQGLPNKIWHASMGITSHQNSCW